jgi:hypothetical protein
METGARFVGADNCTPGIGCDNLAAQGVNANGEVGESEEIAASAQFGLDVLPAPNTVSGQKLGQCAGL